MMVWNAPYDLHSSTPDLVALQPDVQPPSMALTPHGCTLGRATSCDIVIPRPQISRHHARIEWACGRFMLRDLGSVNGTFLNGQLIHDPQPLTNRDVIGLGNAMAIVSFVDVDATQVASGRLRYDPRQMRFYLNHQPIDLTPHQFRLLLHLYRHRGEVRSREQCAEAVWGTNFTPGNDATPLDRLISTLRAAIRQVAPDTNLIETRPGLGYQLLEGY